MSIAGTLFHGYFFAFHLLNIVNNNQLLSGVIKAVTVNGMSLLWVAVLGFIVIYIYSLIGFALLRSYFSASDYLYCSTLWECTVTVIRYGLIGDMFEEIKQNPVGSSFGSFWPLVIYHVTFFIFITTIGLNIIFGIIVDTFSEMRDLKWRAESDMKDTCFICSRNSYDFEHHGRGFDYHVKNEHNMWSYVYFIIHLDDIKESDYTALELYVSKHVESENYDFFPLNQALCLTSVDIDSTETKIDDLLHQVTAIAKKQKEDEAEKKRKVEKLKQKRWQEKHRRHVFGFNQDYEDGEPLISHSRAVSEDRLSREPSGPREIRPQLVRHQDSVPNLLSPPTEEAFQLRRQIQKSTRQQEGQVDEVLSDSDTDSFQREGSYDLLDDDNESLPPPPPPLPQPPPPLQLPASPAVPRTSGGAEDGSAAPDSSDIRSTDL
ncbi:inositol 1,4,5-trisphosphate receptor type 2 [Patella vulgata]|uniref:inositol 1,4,5-trisphosphate receptor type 2 n=1 Tax=Patella vulgata TaxID=6465 RepID=UPI0021807299|nr:inositol 1,4,5-trisphosphate receptor type 2 [Patella vulgata]